MATKRKPVRRKIKLGLEIEPELRDRMDEHHRKDGVTLTAMVDIAIREYLGKRGA